MTRSKLTYIITLALMSSFLTIACQPVEEPEKIEDIQIERSLEVFQADVPTQSAVSPSVSSPERAAESAKILASTIRFEIHGAGISHGTVMNGRYLVTHNHFPFDLTAINDSYPAEYRAFSLYRTDGRPLIDHSPLTNIVVSAADAEMLILDFGTFVDQGYFDFLGIPSAEFAPAVTLAAGLEVAQINWDGINTRVDWVVVREVRQENGQAVIVLNNPLQAGASGGGVFWNGRHIANNWSTQQVEGAESGTILDAYSVAAIHEGRLG